MNHRAKAQAGCDHRWVEGSRGRFNKMATGSLVRRVVHLGKSASLLQDLGEFTKGKLGN